MILFFISCNTDSKSDEKKQISQTEEIINLLIENANGEVVEFRSLYDTLYTEIPTDSLEKIFTIKYLENRGFKIIDYGRGNYPPNAQRIISIQMQNNNCKCTVDKIYYYTIDEKSYEATERISCSNILNTK